MDGAGARGKRAFAEDLARVTTWITICDTCKLNGSALPPVDGAPDGERLAALIEARVAASSAAVRARRHSCLMGCSRACNVAIGAPGKMSYTLGSLAPEAEAADAIVAYAEAHAASEKGVVPYRDWPAGVKGHFVTRHPPLP